MNITVLGETYSVPDGVGRKFYLLMAKGMDEVKAAEVAVGYPAEPEPDPLVALTERFIDALKSMNQPPIFNLTMPPVTVEAGEPPTVNVAAAEVNVPPTVVNVTAPVALDPTIVVDMSDLQVDVPPTNVTVNVPKAELKATVKAEMPSEMRITSMPDRVTQRRISRNEKGQITETADVETDG